MQCPYCNAQNSGAASFCIRCGTALSAAASHTPRPATTRLNQGKYTLLRPLNKGGMGALYLAGETIAGQQRLVVVKEMLEYYDANNAAEKAREQQRFRTEAATLTKLSIAGVPQIFDFFSEGGRNYIVMQFIEGQNLETRLTHVNENNQLERGHPYPVDQVRQWGMKLCKILEVLASKNIVHMDIKPANLILDPGGDIWLVDFGIVKAQPSNATFTSNNVKATTAFGTPGYAPPEQRQNLAEPRSDVYALAATLYHLMTDDDPAKEPGKFSQLIRLPKNIAQALRLALVAEVQKRVTAFEFGRLLAKTDSSPIPPFRWRDGAAAYDPKDLVITADRNWAEAQEYFKGEAWRNWFRDIHRHDLIARMQAIRSAQPKLELALDEFLRQLDPTLPAPRLHLPKPQLDAGVIPWQSKRELDLEVANHGSGCMRVRFTNPPSCLVIESSEYVFHTNCTIRIKIDTSSLSPQSSTQTQYLKIDAGPGGQFNLPVKIYVPEPSLHVPDEALDLGDAYPGAQMNETFQIINPGESTFLGEAHSTVSWVKVKPTHFLLTPKASYEMNVQINTKALPFGMHTAQVNIWARAGKWEQKESLHLGVKISRWKAFQKYWLPPLIWFCCWSAYGGLIGVTLGKFLSMLFGPLIDFSASVMVGALFGALIYSLPITGIGWLGGIGAAHKGIEGAKKGASYGLVTGALAGAVAGGLIFRFLTSIQFGLSEAIQFNVFGSLLGALTGFLLGTALWMLSSNQR